MIEHGFDIPNLQLDDKIHRFDHAGKKTGYYIGFSDTEIVVYGDWKTGERYVKKPDHVNKEVVAKKQILVKKKLKDEQNVIAKELLEEFDGLSNKLQSDYLKNKNIDPNDLKDYGIKSCMTMEGRALCIPVHDVDKKFWGYQKIAPDGSKLFSPGMKTKECFFYFYGLDKLPAYVCEGFATGYSIHKATGAHVYCALSAYNIPNVARVLKKKHTEVIVCADADPVGIAEANKSKCTVIHPEVGDFNDLHIDKGIEAIKEIIAKKVETGEKKQSVSMDGFFLKYLGRNNGVYFYTSSFNREVTMLTPSQHSKANLLGLMPIDMWTDMFPRAKGEGPDWDSAASHMMDECRKKPIFDILKVRGSGAWDHDGEIVLNLGSKLWFKGEHRDLHELNSRFYYKLDRGIIEPDKSNISVREFTNLFELLSWNNVGHAHLTLGWIALAPICGALKWKPHLWIIGESGSGKSTVVQYIAKLIEPYARQAQGPTTEAGLRQSIGNSSLPIVFDEFESDSMKSSGRVQDIIELCRQASSSTDAAILRGSPNGVVQQFNPNFMALVSSVILGLEKQQDFSRFCVVKMKKGSIDDFADINKQLLEILNKEFIQGFFTRQINKYQLIKDNIAVCRKALMSYGDARFADQYAALLGGYFSLVSDEVCKENWVEGFLEVADIKFEVDATDHFDCLSYIMQSMIFESGNKRLISEFIFPDMGYEVRNEILCKYGLKVDHRLGDKIDADNKRLFIQNRNGELNRLFNGTQWHNYKWKESLLRIFLAKEDRTRFGKGNPQHCVSISLAHWHTSDTDFAQGKCK